MRNSSRHPELAGYRELAEEALSTHGYKFGIHYRIIQLDHELYGLNVGDFVKFQDAEHALKILSAIFPYWGHTEVVGTDGIGWWVQIALKDPDDFDFCF